LRKPPGSRSGLKLSKASIEWNELRVACLAFFYIENRKDQTSVAGVSAVAIAGFQVLDFAAVLVAVFISKKYGELQFLIVLWQDMSQLVRQN
jgi:hypothetical protein